MFKHPCKRRSRRCQPALKITSMMLFFPERVKAGLVGLGRRLSGALLLALTALLWLSLLTWSVNDPSLTHQTGNSPGNAAGPLGAILSDLLLQTLGLGAVGCLLAPLIWGLELIYSHRVIAIRTKALFYPASILLLSGALSTLPVTLPGLCLTPWAGCLAISSVSSRPVRPSSSWA